MARPVGPSLLASVVAETAASPGDPLIPGLLRVGKATAEAVEQQAVAA